MRGTAKAPKALGCILLAMLALVAMGSSTARADSTTWLKPEVNTFGIVDGLSGGSSFKFLYGGQEVTCTSVAFEEVLNGEINLLPFAPSFEGCHTEEVLGIGFTVTFTMNDCDLIVKGVPTSPEKVFTGTLDLSCPSGQLEVDIYKSGIHAPSLKPENHLCTITVKPQADLDEVAFKNIPTGGKHHVRVETEVKMSVTRDGSALCGPASGTAEIRGITTLRAFSKEGEATHLTVGHKT